MTDSSTRVTPQRSGPALTAVAVLLAVVAGFMLADDYGMSVDEAANADVGAAALEVYRGEGEDYFSQGEVLAHHGPAYFMFFSITSRLLAAIVPGWVAADGRHLTNFLAFLLSGAALFILCRRWLRPPLAWLTVALFLTQPLLFGYGFVNQKDTPFMAAFVLIVAAGMAVADRLAAQAEDTMVSASGTGRELARRDWSRLRPAWRGLLLAVLSLASLLLLDLLVFGGLSGLLRAGTAAAYEGRGGPLLARLFAEVATHPADVPLDAYLAKLETTMRLSGLPLGLSLIGIALLALGLAFPLTAGRLSAKHVRWLAPALVGAGLGFAVSIRPIGAFAGILVSLFWGLRLKRSSWIPLSAMWLAAAAAAYLSWPYLWTNPLINLWDSLRLTASFPAHDMLYRGVMISSDVLPWHFFPTLAAIQLTEPVLPLILVGLGVLSWRLAHRRLAWDEALILVVWLGAPLFGLVFLGFGIYGNIRQLLFVLPPLFVLAGLAMDAILGALPKVWLRGVVAAILLIPGIAGIVRMHPYEHAYFNRYAGGVDGAWGEYQPSHWCTSLREAAEYLNQAAPVGALVLVDGPVEGVRSFARSDLVVEGIWTALPDPAYVVSCTRTPDEMLGLAGMTRVLQIGRGRAVYAEVLKSNKN